MALAAQRYGFYVHGQCVHGPADVDLASWYDNFRAEEARIASRWTSVSLRLLLRGHEAAENQSQTLKHIIIIIIIII